MQSISGVLPLNYLQLLLILGQRVFIVFVRTAALNGSYQHSPYYWTRDFDGPSLPPPHEDKRYTCSIKDVVVTLDVGLPHPPSPLQHHAVFIGEFETTPNSNTCSLLDKILLVIFTGTIIYCVFRLLASITI